MTRAPRNKRGGLAAVPPPADTDPVETVIDTAAVQPTLPELDLPEYNGLKAVGMHTALTGAGQRITRSHSIRDRVILVVEAKVKDAGHRDTDKGLIYHETLQVLDLFEVQGDPGHRLLTTLRSLYRTADDARTGRGQQLEDLGDVGYVDGSGVALLPAEVAQLRGDPVRAMLADELTPVVVVWSDGQRDLWPDDFPRDAPRPQLGDKYLDSDADLTVAELIHHATGEPIEAILDPAPVVLDESAFPADRAEGMTDEEWEASNPTPASKAADDE